MQLNAQIGAQSGAQLVAHSLLYSLLQKISDEVELTGVHKRHCTADLESDVAEHHMPLQDVNNTVEESLQWSYPPPQAMSKAQKQAGKLSVLTTALSDVTALEEDVVDVTAVADSITTHILQLLQDPR